MELLCDCSTGVYRDGYCRDEGIKVVISNGRGLADKSKTGSTKAVAARVGVRFAVMFNKSNYGYAEEDLL